MKYLESFCYAKAKEIGRCELENSVILIQPFITESMETDLMDDLETIKILLSTLGFPIFEEIKKSQVQEVFICKRKDAYAEGMVSDRNWFSSTITTTFYNISIEELWVNINVSWFVLYNYNNFHIVW
ncbi:hypothetical protein Amet_4281 [Alkaliphilus metalliredigens QYMF]|uniref:Uncharacterized protein n=1 Tax=Alkaliphilus metalliredigens (strain QYMF) TaxID=293826 RepID=A6TVZ0_ALKMQ|nr:hypothetical protein [Alkaliphilus metalliredigens]ABR50358.1 hypothetical protein Amet_4281 [Alkaliphilus metalliredigens QYMF]